MFRTRSRIVTLIALSGVPPVALAIAVIDAGAQCEFAQSPRARTVKLSLVRATARCGSSGHAPNTTTSDGLPACSPPPVSSVYSFDAGGRCELSMRQRGLTGLACVAGTPCSELAIAARCFGVVDATQTPVDDESGWRLRVSLRATIDDTDNGDMTPITIPFEYEMPEARGGKLSLSLKGTVLDLGYLPGPPLFDFPVPACSTLGISPPGTDPPAIGNFAPTTASVEIVDPDGNVFATSGSTAGSPPAGTCKIDLGKRTRGIKGDLVRRLATCPIGSIPAPNSSTAYGLPSCALPSALSSRDFQADSGGCTISVAQKAQPCASMPSQTCTPVTLKLRCRGIAETGGVALVDELGWRLRITVRATLEDALAGDVTVVDFPSEVVLPSIEDGTVKLTTVLPELMISTMPGDALGLPACSSLQVIDVVLVDAAGRHVRRSGYGVAIAEQRVAMKEGRCRSCMQRR